MPPYNLDNSRIAILTNPEQRYWDDIVKQVVSIEKWVNSVHDYKTLTEGFPGGSFKLLIAVDSDTQELVGSICVAIYVGPEPLSAIGMYYVHKDHQGKGIGSRLFQQAIGLCTERKFLYGVEKMTIKYRERHGFNKLPNWNLAAARMNAQRLNPFQLDYDSTLSIMTPSEFGWDRVTKYVQMILPRPDIGTLIRALLSEEQSYCAIAVSKDGQVVGLVRVCKTYNDELSIGPLIGDGKIAASTVLRQVLCRLDSLHTFQSISLQFPSTNQEVLELLNQLTGGDYRLGDVCYPQFTHEIVEISVQKIFAMSHNDVSLI